MARTASPWFREERNAWYVIKDGKRHLLGEHPADAPKPRRKKNRWVVPPTILDRYHELMAAKPEAPPAPKPTTSTTATSTTTGSTTTAAGPSACGPNQAFSQVSKTCVNVQPGNNPCPKGQVPMADRPVCVAKD